MQHSSWTEALPERLGVGLAIVDARGLLGFVNQRLAEMAGLLATEVVGKPVSVLFDGGSEDDGRGAIAHKAKLRKGGARVFVFPHATEGATTTYVVVRQADVEQAQLDATSAQLVRVEELLDRVERVHGESTRPSDYPPSRAFSESPMLALLSRREREIVTALVSARPVKQIAVTLNISPHTVRNHLKSSFRKLNVGSQVELVAKLTQGPLLARGGDAE